ncbi:thioredoxin family protein [Patescibacteria group bacterium]|nr:thioredoxin family protein [Patescibacteria group bacterium]MBU4274537.1 thioredoxin family protein [Patescibacteria group bacterium]MBU4367442.1 thioredoxin family protein [Patescibacteria group bacterium]MBU4461762.1 thioredoxin family protein [Patescibacteria group bacterium]MCG2700146.1 thioredoxin family protein [Candidatus Parcubacteria bacterium]
MGEFKPTFPQFRDNGNGGFAELLKENNPLALFFTCTQNIDGEALNMSILAERFAERYGGRVRFFWVNSGEDKNICQQISINDVPTIVLFYQGKEVARFSCPSSEPGIYYHLDELLNPEPYSGLKRMERIVPVA